MTWVALGLNGRLLGTNPMILSGTSPPSKLENSPAAPFLAVGVLRSDSIWDRLLDLQSYSRTRPE